MDLSSFLTIEFLTALASIFVIDLVLAGDNAIISGMAARNVPTDIRKRVIIYGTIGAIIIRVIATGGVLYLLELPGLLFVGGITLFYIAYKLLADDGGHNISAKDQFGAAVKTIIIADVVTGLDNVLAVAGAAQGNFTLVLIGLALTIPLVIWGSTLIVQMLDKYPLLILFGAAMIIFTGTEMLLKEPLMLDYFPHPVWLKWMLSIIITLGIARLADYPIPYLDRLPAMNRQKIDD